MPESEPTVRLTISGREKNGERFEETHILDDYRKMIFPFHRWLKLDTVTLEIIQEPEQEET